MSFAILTQIAVSFVWAGMVVALSFLETPLKFRAPGMTEALGVAVGRVVFAAMNRIEIALALTIVATLVFTKRDVTKYALFAAVAAAVLVETIWLLPALDARARALLSGNRPDPSIHHTVFVIVEVVKVVLLIAFGLITARRAGA